MGVHDAVPPGFRRGLTACPVCGDEEHVIAVPAVFESSNATEETLAHARHVLHDDDSSMAKKRAARETLATTAPAVVRSQLLAPAPKSSVGCFLVGSVFFAFPAVMVRSMLVSSHNFMTSNDFPSDMDDGDEVFRTIANVATALVVLCLIGLIVSLVLRQQVRSGQPAAEAIWRKGWYCTRCAVVHFTPGDEPAGVSEGQALDPDEFRRMVWTAGGYGGRFRPRS